MATPTPGPRMLTPARLSVELQVPYGDVVAAAARIGARPALTLNDTPYFDDAARAAIARAVGAAARRPAIRGRPIAGGR